MAQGKSGTNGNTPKPSGNNGGSGSPGRGRAPNGFVGGNWPSTVPNVNSGANRGNAKTSKG